MATVYRLLPTAHEFYAELQDRTDLAEAQRHKRFLAVLLLQRMARGHLVRKHVAWLSKNATTIQCAFRIHRARKAYRAALRRAVRNKHAKHYARAARIIQVTCICFCCKDTLSLRPGSVSALELYSWYRIKYNRLGIDQFAARIIRCFKNYYVL